MNNERAKSGRASHEKKKIFTNMKFISTNNFCPFNYYDSCFLWFLGSDAAASLVDSNGQDMIVVIQSDDFDQSQGLIVVDPSQLQHMVTTTGAGGHLTGMFL